MYKESFLKVVCVFVMVVIFVKGVGVCVCVRGLVYYMVVSCCGEVEVFFFGGLGVVFLVVLSCIKFIYVFKLWEFFLCK